MNDHYWPSESWPPHPRTAVDLSPEARKALGTLSSYCNEGSGAIKLIPVGDGFELDADGLQITVPADAVEILEHVGAIERFGETEARVVGADDLILWATPDEVGPATAINTGGDPTLAHIEACLDRVDLPADFSPVRCGESVRKTALKIHPAARRIVLGRHCLHRCEDRRVFHTLTMAPQSLRRFVQVAGEQLVDLDLKSAHVFFLAQHLRSFEDQAYVNEGNGLARLIEEGDFYAALGSSDRSALKIDFQRVLAGKGQGTEARAGFESMFPKALRVLVGWEAAHGEKFAKTMQRLEARLMIDHVGKRAAEERIFFLPIHDGCLTLPSEAEELRRLIIEEASRVEGVGEGVSVTSERLSPEPVGPIPDEPDRSQNDAEDTPEWRRDLLAIANDVAVRIDDDRWEEASIERIKTRLKTHHGISATKPRGSAHSPLEGALQIVRDEQAADGIKPLLTGYAGPYIDERGRRWLNPRTQRPLEPVELPPEDWAWLDQYLDGLFGDNRARVDAWVRHAYVGALDGQIERGLGLILVGDTGGGKTFFGRCVLGELLGSSEDATDYLARGSEYNGALCDSIVWAVDDPARIEGRTSFAGMLKTCLANDRITRNEKFQRRIDVTWTGRVVITLNDDSGSMENLPRLDISIKDKLLILPALDHAMFDGDSPSDAELKPMLQAYGYWLLHSKTPEEFKGRRFGLQGWIDPKLADDIRQHGPVPFVEEVLLEFVRDNGDWEGSAGELHSALDMQNVDLRANGIRSAVSLGRYLSQLAKEKSCGWIAQKRSGKKRVWALTSPPRDDWFMGDDESKTDPNRPF